MSTPPDEPTRRLPSSESPPPETGPRVREREVYPEQDGSWLEELRDQIRSLKTAVALLGVLAVTALGVAAWALISGNDDEGEGQTSSGVSPARVSELEERVDELESRTENAPSEDDLSQLRSDQRALANQVEELEGQSGEQQPDAASQQSVDALQQDVQDLSQRLDEVEQEQQQQQQDQGATP